MGWLEGLARPLQTPWAALCCPLSFWELGPNAFWDIQGRVDNSFLASSHTEKWEEIHAVLQALLVRRMAVIMSMARLENEDFWFLQFAAGTE